MLFFSRLKGAYACFHQAAEPFFPVTRQQGAVAQQSEPAEFLCSGGYFSQGVGRHDKQAVDGHTHEGGGGRTAAGDREGQVERCEHQADDGEDKSGLSLARVLCRAAGKNAACKREAAKF